jgi:hypothetical protein
MVGEEGFLTLYNKFNNIKLIKMKTIKRSVKIYIFLIIAIISTTALYSQKSGVFRIYSDYSTGKMEYGIDCATEKHKIILNDFLGKDFITVVHEGKRYNLKKNEIWGFQMCDDKVTRFQGKEHFELQDKGTLWIYIQQNVQSGNPKTGGSKTVTTYYYSKSGDSEIKELTLLNIKAVFPNNHELHDAIDGQFKSDASLYEYDEFHKHFKINHFLDGKGIK